MYIHGNNFKPLPLLLRARDEQADNNAASCERIKSTVRINRTVDFFFSGLPYDTSQGDEMNGKSYDSKKTYEKL